MPIRLLTKAEARVALKKRLLVRPPRTSPIGDGQQGRLMAKRHFYTDPVAGAWMAKHFGMIVTKDGDAYRGGNPLAVIRRSLSRTPHRCYPNHDEAQLV